MESQERRCTFETLSDSGKDEISRSGLLCCAKIREIEDEIARKHEQLDKRLAAFYARAYRASGSAEARAERAARTHKLCQLGGLVEKAGLGTMTPAALLGMLLQQREYMQKSPSVLSRWQADGERALAARPTEQER